uniref:Uncharacterized protein n=1 Tax=Anguilla anguilla TaxID=7936 RepID=A0A0E9SZX1_ANGAN
MQMHFYPRFFTNSTPCQTHSKIHRPLPSVCPTFITSLPAPHFLSGSHFGRVHPFLKGT